VYSAANASGNVARLALALSDLPIADSTVWLPHSVVNPSGNPNATNALNVSISVLWERW